MKKIGEDYQCQIHELHYQRLIYGKSHESHYKIKNDFFPSGAERKSNIWSEA